MRNNPGTVYVNPDYVIAEKQILTLSYSLQMSAEQATGKAAAGLKNQVNCSRNYTGLFSRYFLIKHDHGSSSDIL